MPRIVLAGEDVLGEQPGAAERHGDFIADPDVSEIGSVLSELAAKAAEEDRPDLADRLTEAAARAARAETLVCVVGEFKKGKSALINGLLERDVCPVDDDLATAAVTVVRHQDHPTVTVRRRGEGELVIDGIAPEDVEKWAVEHDGDQDRKSVELVDIGMPHPLLERGIALVDTPGVGGLNSAHAIATMAFLPSADLLIFVTDASAEMSASEVEFLKRSVGAGPPILVAVTKVDMYPKWQRIIELDQDRLESAGIGQDAFPVSATLRGLARAQDSDAIDGSGYPALLEAILETASQGAKARTVARCAAEVRPAVEQLREPIATEVAALERPETAEQLSSQLDEVRAKLDALDDADARWSVTMDDEFAELRSRTVFNLQAALRQLVRDTHEEIEEIDPSRSWAELSQRVQNEVATAVRATFLEATDGAEEIHRKIADLLSEADEDTHATGTPITYEVTDLWKDGPEFGGITQTGMLAGMGLLAGAVVGVEMLGMLGTLLGAAIAGPAVLGAALAFGGKQVIDERRRQLADRRQEARSFVAEFAKDVEFEVEGRLASVLSDLQRQMRSRYAQRIRQLQRTNEEAAEALERGLEQHAGGQQERLSALRAELAALDELMKRAKAASSRLAASG